MRAFTQDLPESLRRLEMIRQVLELHGFNAAKEEWSPPNMEMRYLSTWNIGWEQRRCGIVIRAFVTIYKDGSIACLELQRPKEDRIYVQEHGTDTWMAGDDHYRRRSLNDPLRELVESCPAPDIEGEYCSDAVAREVVGMIAAFFASLPEDPPTSTP